jgi:chaperonin GroEL (HSP60 family)
MRHATKPDAIAADALAAVKKWARDRCVAGGGSVALRAVPVVDRQCA